MPATVRLPLPFEAGPFTLEPNDTVEFNGNRFVRCQLPPIEVNNGSFQITTNEAGHSKVVVKLDTGQMAVFTSDGEHWYQEKEVSTSSSRSCWAKTRNRFRRLAYLLLFVLSAVVTFAVLKMRHDHQQVRDFVNQLKTGLSIEK